MTRDQRPAKVVEFPKGISSSGRTRTDAASAQREAAIDLETGRGCHAPQVSGSSGWTRTSNPPVNSATQVEDTGFFVPVARRRTCCSLVLGKELFRHCSVLRDRS